MRAFRRYAVTRLLPLVALIAAAVGGIAAYQGTTDGDSARENGSSGAPAGERRPAGRADVRFYLTTTEIAVIKRNIARYEWARRAWRKTKERADDALGSRAEPPDPNQSFGGNGGGSSCETDEGWFCDLYLPGLDDGHDARELALAYAVTGDRRYGRKAKEILLAWAREYNPPARRIGHYVAEPVGFMIKGFMAFDLVQDVFSRSEEAEFRRWARYFVTRGQENADDARDSPWNDVAPFSNSATWTRALAVYAAAAAGEPYLSRTLSWNWEHETSRGRDYGWLYLIDNGMELHGQMVEERARRSIGYALYAWHPLALIADVAKHARFPENLFSVETRSGKSLRLAAEHYAVYLTEKSGDPYPDERTTYQDYDATLLEYRAVYELAAKLDRSSKEIRAVPRFGGKRARGGNYDGHITAFNALTGAS